ncbi:MAG: CHAT domain-containing protein [Polyangia bacterium]
MSTTKPTILFLSANPSTTRRLELGQELGAIKEQLRSCGAEDRIELQIEPALRADMLQAALLGHRPQIVHFSAHGSPEGELELGGSGSEDLQAVSAAQLKQVFEVLGKGILCVVLNACYSEKQAEALRSVVPCVVGMSRAVSDPAAQTFAASFYQALARGENVATAFKVGCNQIGFTPAAEEQTVPRLLEHEEHGAEHLYLFPPEPVSEPPVSPRRESGGSAAAAPENASWEGLLRMTTIREHLSSFRSLFATVSEQIRELAWHKKLHDLFQELNHPYHNLKNELARCGDTPDSWKKNKKYLVGHISLTKLKGLEILAHIESAPPRVKTVFEGRKRILASAIQMLEKAQSSGDIRVLNTAVYERLAKSLENDPAVANQHLVEIARGLDPQLVRVVDALQSANSKLKTSVHTDSRVQFLGEQILELSSLRESLSCLVGQHDCWQSFDTYLRPVISATTVPEFRSGWELIRMVEPTILTPEVETEKWAADLKKRSADIEQALAAEKPAEGSAKASDEDCSVFGLNQEYFDIATMRFEEIDKALLRVCEKLKEKGDLLDVAVRMLDGKP